MKDFSKRLKSALESNSMTQKELAAKINMSPDAVNTYCNGRRRPSIDVLVLICNALDESADYLLGLTE